MSLEMVVFHATCPLPPLNTAFIWLLAPPALARTFASKSFFLAQIEQRIAFVEIVS